MKRKVAVSIGIVLILALAIVVWQGFFASDLVNELPPHWNLDDIAEATPPYGVKGRVLVLAWTILEDDRPLRLESCLVWRDWEDGEGYSLAHLCRNPSDKTSEWHLSQVHVSGTPGTKYWPGLDILHAKRFTNRPTNEEIYAALSQENVGWRFDIHDSWKRARCHVCEENWLKATGEPPTQFFVLPQRGFLDSLGLSRWLNRR